MRIEAHSLHWQAKVNALADRVFGTAFFESPAQIQRDVASCVCVAIDKNEEVTCFVRGRLLPKGGLGDFLEHRLSKIFEGLDKADADGALGVIQTVVVAPEHQGKGQRLMGHSGQITNPNSSGAPRTESVIILASLRRQQECLQ